MIVTALESERGRPEGISPLPKDFSEALGIGGALAGVIDDQPGTWLLAMKADESMPVIGDHQAIAKSVQVGRRVNDHQ